MLVVIDKRGSINLPIALRRQLGLDSETYLDVQVQEGGALVLHPVVVYPTVRLSVEGLAKLQEARESGTGASPDWLREELDRTPTDPQQEVPFRCEVVPRRADRTPWGRP